MARVTISELQEQLHAAQAERDRLRTQNAELQAILKIIRVALEQATGETYRGPG